MRICYSNGKSGFSLRVWGFSLDAEVWGFSDRHVRLGELIGRYRTLEPSMPLSTLLMAMGFVHSAPL